MKYLAQHLDHLHEIVNKYNLSIVNNLPEIIVVGDQSSGKSSLLQSIIKRDILPYGDKLVTRCPIRVSTLKDKREFATFSDIPDKEFKISEVSQVLFEKNKEIENSEYISSKDILVNLYGPEMLNLTLVDLPGIVKIRLESQPVDIVSKVETLIRNRIQNENTLILAVVSAGNDMASSSALAFAKSVDEFGKRTIIVFTMMDRCQNPISILQGLDINSELGYLGVICRSPKDVAINMSIEDQFKAEAKYYLENPIFSNYRKLLGIENLVNKIEIEFKKSLSNCLPEIKLQIERKIEAISNEIDEIGEPFPFLDNQILFVQNLIESVFLMIEGVVDGKIVEINKFGVSEVSFRDVFIKFIASLDARVIRETDPSIQENLKSLYLSKGLEGVSVISLPLLKNIMKMNLSPLKTEINESLQQTKQILQKLIR